MTSTAVVPPKPAIKAPATGVTPGAVTAAAAPPASLARSTVSRSKAWSGEDRYRMIAEAAYFRAERRGFVSGSELQDWLAAETEVDDLLGVTPTR